MNIDLNALIAKINTNNDSTITKDEIKAYEDKYGVPSIFANYFKTITKETSVSDFTKNLQQIAYKKETQKGDATSQKEKEQLWNAAFDTNKEYAPEYKFRLQG